MALNNATKITQLAKVFDVNAAQLTPAAKKLTKGDLMRLAGTPDDLAAIKKYASKGAPLVADVVKVARTEKLKLTVEDLHSIQQVFGSPRIPADRIALARKTSIADIEVGDVTIYVCCCPCCCATAVISPKRNAVA